MFQSSSIDEPRQSAPGLEADCGGVGLTPADLSILKAAAVEEPGFSECR
jgi:hypothetical protein